MDGETRRDELPVTPAPPSPVAPAAAIPAPLYLPQDSDTRLVGFAGDRFAIIDTPQQTIVFDAESSSGFRVYGHPITRNGGSWSPWNDVLAADTLSVDVETALNTRMLVRTEHGIQVVDLADRGALLAGWRGEADGASIADDGETFATFTKSEITLVRITDGARVTYGFEASGHDRPGIHWTSRSVSWVDGSGAHVVDLATWREQRVELPHAALARSKDGSTFAVVQNANVREGTPAVVEVWRLGESKPAHRVTSAFAADLMMEAAGTKMAWVESSGEYAATTYLHTLDLASGVHARFPADSHCSIAQERLVSIENGELHTDGECTTGCPSFTSQSSFIAYDFESGRVLRRWRGALQASFNDGLGQRLRVRDQLAKRYGLETSEPLPLLHHPAKDALLVDVQGGLRLADVTTGAMLAKLENAADFSTYSAHFWPKTGARIVAVTPGSIAVWETSTGMRVWATGR